MAARTSTITRSQTLDINDLAEILDLLKRHGYSTSYYDLGLYLGLLPGTLDVIKENNKGDVNASLRECLKTWLQQADDVKSVGLPSYYSLIQALRKLGENAVADGIDRKKHPACVIFTQCESNKCIVDILPRLVIFLCLEKIIGEMLVPTTGEGSVLLKVVKEAVCADYHNLEKFATVLMRLNAQSVTSVAVSMLQDYRKVFPEDCITMISKVHISINLPLKLTPEFTKIRTMFTDLIDDVAQAINNSVRYENLKRYIGRNETLRPHLAHCQNTDEIIELIGDHCSLINVALLESVVKKCKVKEADSAIQEYKNEIESFHKEGRPLRQFLNQYLAPASSLQCEEATILVHKEVKDYELRDINVLMTVAFETLAPNVRVHVIKEGNSFIITCSFPVLLSESLIATALDNIDSLIERGVMKLTIGYSTVYDHEKLYQDVEAVTSKKDILTPEMKQQLYASVYSSQGTMEQLLISRTIQLLNSEEELASVQQLKEKNEKLEAEMKVLSGMKWEVDQLRTREKKNVEELEMLQEKISVQSVEILEKEDQQKQLQKSLEEKEMKRKVELQKIDGLFYSFLQEKDTELQEVIQMQQVNDTQYLQAKRVFLEHFIELSVVMAVTPNRLSVVKQLYGSGLISVTSFEQATKDDTVSGIESGIVLMNDLKASINERPELISSLFAVLEGNEAFKSIAKRMGKDIPPTLRMYYGQVLYEVKKPGMEWLMRVFFERNLSRVKTHISDIFNNAELGQSFSFTFNDADGYIELCFNETVPDGWSIRPHKSPVIASRYDIEEYGNKSPPQFPECLITITATKDKDTINELNYPVTMRGVTSDTEKINIVLTRGRDDIPKVSELIEFHELLIKGQLPLLDADTIRKIRNAVNDHEGMSLLRQAFEENPTLLHEMREAAGKIKEPVEDSMSPEYITMKEMLADLVDLLAGNPPFISQLNNYLFSSDLIPKAVHVTVGTTGLTPYDRANKIFSSVLATLECHSNPNSVFSSLITSLQKVGLKSMASKLMENLKMKGGHVDPNLEQQPSFSERPLQATITGSQSSTPTTVIELSSKSEVATNIERLFYRFASLDSNIRDEFEELVKKGKVKLKAIARSAAAYLSIQVSSLKYDNVDELFDSLQPHYDFFCCGVLKHLTDTYLSNAQTELTQYIDSVDKFSESSQLKHIRSTIKEKLSSLPAAASPTTSDQTKPVVIKLTDRWDEMTFKNFKRVLQFYFGHIVADISTIVEIHIG